MATLPVSEMLKAKDRISKIFCSEATVTYLVKEMERCGLKKTITDVSKMYKKKPDAIPIYASHRMPIGYAVALDRDNNVVGTYDVPIGEKEGKDENKGRAKNRRQR